MLSGINKSIGELMYYVYCYIDPRTNQPFYIGKGTANRKYSHLKETLETTINKRKYYKIQSIFKNNQSPEIIEVDSYELESDAYALEEYLIECYGRKDYDENGILMNITIGNNPPSRKGAKLTEEQKENSRKNRKPLSKEYLASLKGRIPWNKGMKGNYPYTHVVTEETKQKLRRPCKEETKQKLRECHLGKKRPASHKQAMKEGIAKNNPNGRIPWNKGKKGLTKKTKSVILVSPDGIKTTYKSLKEACSEANLTYTKMSSVNSGKLKHFKGWTIEQA